MRALELDSEFMSLVDVAVVQEWFHRRLNGGRCAEVNGMLELDHAIDTCSRDCFHIAVVESCYSLDDSIDAVIEVE